VTCSFNQLFDDHLFKLLQPSRRTIPQKIKNGQQAIFPTTDGEVGE
jgi:hypothetical protein